MEAQKVDMFIMTNNKFFEGYQIAHIRHILLATDDSKWMTIQSLQFIDPSTILLVSLLAGSLGIDRFMIGDTGMGVGKLLTCGGFMVWTIIDWFMIRDATKGKNLVKLEQALY